jgi:hypothetical protein
MGELPKSVFEFFRYFSDHKFESPYYTALGHLLAGLTGDQSKSKWELFEMLGNTFLK